MCRWKDPFHVPYNKFFRHNVPIEQVACGLKRFLDSCLVNWVYIHLLIFQLLLFALKGICIFCFTESVVERRYNCSRVETQ